MRDAIVNQLGSLLLANVELAHRVQELEAETAQLKKTQSDGKAQAEAMLAAETKEGNN